MVYARKKLPALQKLDIVIVEVEKSKFEQANKKTPIR